MPAVIAGGELEPMPHKASIGLTHWTGAPRTHNVPIVRQRRLPPCAPGLAANAPAYAEKGTRAVTSEDHFQPELQIPGPASASNETEVPVAELCVRPPEGRSVRCVERFGSKLHCKILCD